MNEFNIYESIKTSDLRARLGWWEHSGGSDTSELVSALMLLCGKVETLERENAALKKALADIAIATTGKQETAEI